MAFRCLCGSLFDSFKLLGDHVEKSGHRVRCSCGRFFKNDVKLQGHRQYTKCNAQLETADETTNAAPSTAAQVGTRRHKARCSCRRSFRKKSSLHDHQKDTNHTGEWTAIKENDEAYVEVTPAHACSICDKICANECGVKEHIKNKHPSCPACDQHFESTAQREGHQRTNAHCFCTEHEIFFDTVFKFELHKRCNDHASTYECIDCERPFKTQRALDDHLDSLGHAAIIEAAQKRVAAAEEAAKQEEENLRCKECKRDFKTATSFKQHKDSVKHKPLSELACPLSERCKKSFTSPSALLLHIETGKCKSGMNRLKLNALVHMHDTGRHITHTRNTASVLSTASAAGSLPTAFDFATSFGALSLSGRSMIKGGEDTTSKASTTRPNILAVDVTDTESVISDTSGVPLYTRSHSRAPSSIGGVMLTPSKETSEWSFVNGAITPSLASLDDSSVNTMQYDGSRKVWPCIILGCTRTFKKKYSLLEHLNSVAHGPKLFHCPSGLALPGLRHEYEFKTLSGFAQHLEAGACGQEALKFIVNMIEPKIAQATGKKVKLLKKSAGVVA